MADRMSGPGGHHELAEIKNSISSSPLPRHGEKRVGANNAKKFGLRISFAKSLDGISGIRFSFTGKLNIRYFPARPFVYRKPGHFYPKLRGYFGKLFVGRSFGGHKDKPVKI